MLLSNLSKTIKIIKTYNFTKNKNFFSITSNSKLTNKNTIFIYDKKTKLKHKYIKEAIRNHEGAIELVRRRIKLSEEWAEEYEEKYRKCENWIKEKIDNGEQIIG